MDRDFLLDYAMPTAIGIIMLGLGLSLTIKDFVRVVKFPQAALIGILCQLILIPILCFLIVLFFDLSPILAVGMMLLSATPGGPMANLYSHISNGDVALNVTLTAINSVLTLFTLPLIVNFSLEYFMNDHVFIPIQFHKALEVFAIVLIPIAIGMLIHHWSPSLTQKLEKYVKLLSAFFLIAVIIALVVGEKQNMKSYFQQIGYAALAFNVISMVIGYFLPRLISISARQAIAIGMEVGIHNGALAIFIALNIFKSETMAVPAAIYSLIEFITATIFGVLVNINLKSKIKSEKN
ncbi:MAG: bile acid:sodium symporter family protein [Chitinophagales bacterium]|nr:bile acid:sodium symporter family protein [Chitinophagales bacterium]MCZ2394129.1 bile acid:sodium symporter family protein [Chitinophagales bacterium]